MNNLNIDPRNRINRSLWRCGFFLIPLILAMFALSQTAQAVTPAPDGGYPGDNTAEGDGALNGLTNGVHNTAIGFSALLENAGGSNNTATGDSALASNTGGSSNTAFGVDAMLMTMG